MHRTNPLVSALVAALVAVTVVAAPLHATAAPAEGAEAAAPAGADALSDAAVAAFKAREYDKAVDLFQQAYSLDPQPNYLFNIGRVYEEKGDLEKAVANYQEFVKQPGVDLEARENATARLKVLRQTLDQLREDAEPEAKPDTTPVAEGPTPAEQAAAAKKRKMRIAGYSLLGVGGGALVIGAVFGGLAVGKSNDAKDAAFVDDKLSLRQEAKGRAAVGDGLLITGGVLAAAGLALVLATLGKGRGKAGTDTAASRVRRGLAVRPALGPTGAGRWGAGLSLGGSF